MNSITLLAQDFLAQKRIAVVGISSKRNTPANGIYRKLKSLHYEVFPVSRSCNIFENDSCYSDLLSIPSAIDGVIIVTNAANTEKIVEQCVALSIPRVWMHCAEGTTAKPSGKNSSVSERAVQLCRNHNITVIPGACPMMFCQFPNFFHRFLRWALSISGKLKLG